MKRIFYRFENDLYLDIESFMDMAERSGLNAKDLKGVSFIREGETFINKFGRLVHVN